MRPIVIVPACTRDFGEHPYHAAQHKYVDAVTLGADCASLILPSSGESLDLETIFGTIDGIMELEEGKLRVTLIKAVAKASQRAKELILER